MRDLVNEGGEKRVNRGMDYISHCNKVQKGRFNDLVKFSNERQGEGEEEDDELAEEDIFDWVQQKWGLELDQLYSLADVKGETNPELATQRRDLVRGIEDSDRKKRWEMYLTERPRWEKGQEMLRELGRVRAWKLSDLLEKVIKKGDQLASADKGNIFNITLQSFELNRYSTIDNSIYRISDQREIKITKRGPRPDKTDRTAELVWQKTRTRRLFGRQQRERTKPTHPRVHPEQRPRTTSLSGYFKRSL